MTHSIIVDIIHYYKNITLRRLTCTRKFNIQNRGYHLIFSFLYQIIQSGININTIRINSLKWYQAYVSQWILTKAFILLWKHVLIKMLLNISILKVPRNPFEIIKRSNKIFVSHTFKHFSSMTLMPLWKRKAILM